MATTQKQVKNPLGVQRMATPTLVVGRRIYEQVADKWASQIIIHGKRQGLKIVPKQAMQIEDNRVFFPEAPKTIIFRQRFTSKTTERKVATIFADNSERYDLKFIVNLKP